MANIARTRREPLTGIRSSHAFFVTRRKQTADPEATKTNCKVVDHELVCEEVKEVVYAGDCLEYCGATFYHTPVKADDLCGNEECRGCKFCTKEDAAAKVEEGANKVMDGDTTRESHDWAEVAACLPTPPNN